MLNAVNTGGTKQDFQVKRSLWPEGTIYYGADVYISKVFEKEKLKGRIIGLSEYNFLILAMPLVIGYRARYSPGSSVIVKFVKDGAVYGFYSEVLMIQYDPAPLLFTKYPKELECFEFRTSKRFTCNVPARLFNDKAHYYCMINDISNGGCHLTVHRSSGCKNIKAKEEVTLLMSLYGLGELELECHVKSSTRKDDQLTYGIMFKDGESHEKLQTYMDMLQGKFK